MSKSNKLFQILAAAGICLSLAGQAVAQGPLNGEIRSPLHVKAHATNGPTGLTPAQTRNIYSLPSSGGSGTIAIVDAYDYPQAETDLNTFSSKFGLPGCTTANGCFEKHKIGSPLVNKGWALEEALDTQWAHAIAPNAKILLVEAKSNSNSNMLAAVDYARSRADVVAVSMSWGQSEFSSQSSLDSHFTSSHGVTFFASSGDNGNGVQWPAVSPNVIGVGGTTVALNPDGSLQSETAWKGSGGGLSNYMTQPSYQSAYGITNSNGRRAVPDVSYDADPNSGFSVIDTTGYSGQKGWFVIGGTSAGAPQWAAIRALGGSVSSSKVYTDAKTGGFFRDVTAGTNGPCGFYCNTLAGYDYVTGVGSPLTINF